MARTMGVARKSTGGKAPRPHTAPPPSRARGIPSLATYEAPVPVPEIQTRRKTRAETLRLRAHDDMSSTTELVPRAAHFNFLGLPAELRIRVYEMCVSVTEYITYDERDFCTCGQKHLDQPSAAAENTCKYVLKTGDKFKPRLPGCYYPLVPKYLDRQKWEIPRREYAQAYTTPKPHILEVSRQVRDEALPIFYAMNDFVFEDCECLWVTRWIYNVVRSEHLKHIKSITWDGPLINGGDEPRMEDDTLIQMSSIIMLAQLNIMGNCKLRFMPDDYGEDIHYACILHSKISSLVARKGLTAADAENELSRVDKHEVVGLVYCIVKKLSNFCEEVLDKHALTYLPAGLDGNSDWKRDCDCEDLEEGNEIAWLGRKLISGADGST